MNPVKIPEGYKYISAFLTMRCNLSCGFCLNNLENSTDFHRESFPEVSGDEWIEMLNRIKSRSQVPITLSGGEPFLHAGFIGIINGLKPDLNIDILTNLQWGEKGIERFIDKVDPSRVRRDAPYASIRVSYHPGQMGDGATLVANAKKMKDAGFSIGIWSVLFPSPEQLAAINQMQFRCRDAGIDFRLKEFTGEYKGETYGDYSRYPHSVGASGLKSCLCKTSELLIGPNGDVYRCHRDVYAGENPIGNLGNPEFQIQDKFRSCDRYGECHPCDVKVKTNYKQQLGHTSVKIRDVKPKH